MTYFVKLFLFSGEQASWGGLTGLHWETSRSTQSNKQTADKFGECHERQGTKTVLVV